MAHHRNPYLAGQEADPPEPSASGATGKGLQWEADMVECQLRGWYSRWNDDRWELVSKGMPGAVEDLVRLAALRQGQAVERDEDWRQALQVKFLKDQSRS
jgi:hypothetical protein